MLTSSVGSRSVVRETLRHPNYQKLMTGSVIAAFGDRINQTALLSIVVYETHNVAKFGADVTFWWILPMVILGPFAVALIDRWDRRRTMVVCDVARACLVAGLPALFHFFRHHYAIYMVLFLVGTFSALFTPSRLAILPNLVKGEMLMTANAIASQAGTVATLVAMPIAGWIIENCGRNTGFMINSATYLVSALLILGLRPSGGGAPPPGSHRPWRDLGAGLGFIGSNGPVLCYVLFAGVAQCLVAVFFVSFLQFGDQILGARKVEGITLLFCVLGIGMGAGAVWLGLNSRRADHPVWPMGMMGLTGVGMLALGFVHHPWLAAPVLAAIGFFAVMVLVPLDTFLQKRVGDEFRGRVFAVRGTLIGVAFLFSLQFSKAILHHLGVADTLRLLGAAALLLAAIGVPCLRRLVRV